MTVPAPDSPPESQTTVAPPAPPAGPPHASVVVGGQRLTTVADVVAVAHGTTVAIDPLAVSTMKRSRAVLETLLEAETPVYGLNTGLGPRRDQHVPVELLDDYQEQIIRSHAGALGPALAKPEARAAMFTRVVGLATGYSGANPAAASAIVDLLNRDVVPDVPSVGSIGAADLQILAGIARVLTGSGHATVDGVRMNAAEALASVGLEPLELGAKEGLALISANSYGVGLACLALHLARTVADLADVAAAVSMEAMSANLSPFDPRVFEARPFPHSAVVAQRIRDLVAGGHLTEPGTPVALQDPISIRTVPQVHGSWRRQLDEAGDILTVELNSGGDNPLVDAASGQAVSNGNFHPMELTLAFEAMRLGLAHVAAVSERRTVKLVARHRQLRSVADEVRSGDWRGRFRVPVLVGNTAAALCAEVKHLAGPVSLGGPPIANDVEDHAGLLPQAVRLTQTALDRVTLLLLIEIVLGISLGDIAFPARWGRHTQQIRAAVTAIFTDSDDHTELTAVVDRVHETLTTMSELFTEQAQ